MSSSNLQLLIEMGFHQIRAEKALHFTDNNGLEPALEWLCLHEDDTDIDVPLAVTISNITDIKTTDGDVSAKSLKCDDCGKLFSNDSLVQIHSTRTGHINFSESVEEIKPLSEEEKRVQMTLLQEKMKQKREEREKQEEDDNLRRERMRRQQGKSIIDAKTKFKEDEIKKLAEQNRKEKEDDRLYRQRLKEEIARDREERRQAHLVSSSNIDSTATQQPIVTEVKPLELKPNVGNFNSCRIQIRNVQGQPWVDTFSADDCLSKVARRYREQSSIGEQFRVKFRTTMPPKLYGTESMDTTLRELGFCPSIVLMVVLEGRD